MNVCKELIRLCPKAKIAYLNGDASPAQLKKEGFTGIDYHFSAYTDNPDLINQSRKQNLCIQCVDSG
ncbi:MAG: hypothetical protein PHR13_11955 [Dysgonamonadaceae bacterium]|nr:hypothetical protein [Dysgonamonadaceae bacterium]